MMSASPLRNFREFRLLELSEKSRGSLQQNLMGHQNGTFRPILTSVYGQIHGQSVARTTFRTVSLGSSVNRGDPPEPSHLGIIVNASEELEAGVSGSGSVEYVGDPAVKQNVSGAAEVRK